MRINVMEDFGILDDEFNAMYLPGEDIIRGDEGYFWQTFMSKNCFEPAGESAGLLPEKVENEVVSYILSSLTTKGTFFSREQYTPALLECYIRVLIAKLLQSGATNTSFKDDQTVTHDFVFGRKREIRAQLSLSAKEFRESLALAGYPGQSRAYGRSFANNIILISRSATPNFRGDLGRKIAKANIPILQEDWVWCSNYLLGTESCPNYVKDAMLHVLNEKREVATSPVKKGKTVATPKKKKGNNIPSPKKVLPEDTKTIGSKTNNVISSKPRKASKRQPG